MQPPMDEEPPGSGLALDRDELLAMGTPFVEFRISGTPRQAGNRINLTRRVQAERANPAHQVKPGRQSISAETQEFRTALGATTFHRGSEDAALLPQSRLATEPSRRNEHSGPSVTN